MLNVPILLALDVLEMSFSVSFGEFLHPTVGDTLWCHGNTSCRCGQLGRHWPSSPWGIPDFTQMHSKAICLAAKAPTKDLFGEIIRLFQEEMSKAYDQPMIVLTEKWAPI